MDTEFISTLVLPIIGKIEISLEENLPLNPRTYCFPGKFWEIMHKVHNLLNCVHIKTTIPTRLMSIYSIQLWVTQRAQ